MGKYQLANRPVDIYLKGEDMRNNIKRILMFLLIVTIGLFYFGNRFKQDKNKEVVNKIRKIEEKRIEDITSESTDEGDSSDNSEIQEMVEIKRNKINEINALKRINPDVIGIIDIPNTQIYYPILQTSNNDYYLNHNINNEYDKNGAIYLDYENDYKTSDNLVLYGHNMQNGNMFSDLIRYNEYDYLQNNRDIYLYFEDQEYHYKIISGMFLDLSNNNDFYFNQILDFDKEYNAIDYLEDIEIRTDNYIDEDIKEDSKLLTLSTCTFETSDARLLVVAVLDEK